MPMRTVRSETSQAVGATANGNVVIEAPFSGKVVEVTYTPVAAVTGAASPASRTLSLVNRGQAGAGTTTVASLALVGGVNLVQYDEKSLTLSATPSDLVVAAGDELTLTSTAVTSGTGLADPGGTWTVTFERND